MKKIIAISILLLLIVFLVFACATEQSENDKLSFSSAVESDISSQSSWGESIDNSKESSDIPSDFSAEVGSHPETSLPTTESLPDNSNSPSQPDESDFESSAPDMSLPVDGDISDNETSSDIPSDPEHSCKFVKGATVDPTCTAKGYTLYSCSCGKTEKMDEVASLGHKAGEWVTVKEATTTSTGLEQLKCSRCGAVIEEKTIDRIPADEDKYNVPATAANAKLVEERVLFYINEYREDEGTAKAEFLWKGKMYQYAKMRAEQIVDNYEHDREDIKAVCNELKFGEYHLNLSDGVTGCLVEPYYYGGCSEAIAGSYFGYRTVDEVAKKVASAIHNSSGHWSYVGAATTKYISVGAYTTHAEEGKWYFCIATSSTNKYDSIESDYRYHADYDFWCENYEYAVKSYLGIIENPLDPDGSGGIKPERIEPWWDEWIAEMLSEGLIDQAWYDEMIEKGYIIEVD